MAWLDFRRDENEMIRAGTIKPGQLDEVSPDLSAMNRRALGFSDLLGINPTASDALALMELYEVDDVDDLLHRLSWLYPHMKSSVF